MSRKSLVIGSVIAVLAIAGAVGAFFGYQYWDRQRLEAERKSVLECNDRQVGEQVFAAFDQWDVAQFARVRAVRLEGIRETGFDRSPPRRQCAGRILGSDHSHRDVTYTVENAPDNQFTVRLHPGRVSDETPAKPD